MKSKILLAVVSLVLFGSSVSAQFKTVSQTEYDEIYKIKEKQRNLSRVVITETKTYSGKEITKTQKLLQEYESAERNKWTFYEIVGENTKKTLEIIYYDKRELRRENEGEWKEIKREASGGIGGGFRISGKEITNVKQYAIGTDTYDGKSARLFSFYRVYDFGKHLNFYNSLIWVNSDGLIAKEVSMTNDFFPENVVEREEVSYLYNPANLKITIPIAK